MAKTAIALPFDQLTRMIRQLPQDQKMKLWRLLTADLFGRDVDQELDTALHAVWTANPGVTEDEAMADALEAIRAFRSEETADRS